MDRWASFFTAMWQTRGGVNTLPYNPTFQFGHHCLEHSFRPFVGSINTWNSGQLQSRMHRLVITSNFTRTALKPSPDCMPRQWSALLAPLLQSAGVHQGGCSARLKQVGDAPASSQLWASFQRPLRHGSQSCVAGHEAGSGAILRSARACANI